MIFPESAVRLSLRVPLETFLTYCILCYDAQSRISAAAKLSNGEMLSSLLPEEISHLCGISEEVALRSLRELAKLGWVDVLDSAGGRVYKLTNSERVFYTDGVEYRVDDSFGEKIVQALKRPKKIEGLSEKTKKAMLGEVKREALPRGRHSYTFKLLERWVELYVGKYKEECLLPNDSIAFARTLINRATKRSLGPEETEKIFEFIFKNWDRLKELLKWQTRPTLNMIGTSAVWLRIVSYFREGLPPEKGAIVAKREEDYKGPVEGW